MRISSIGRFTYLSRRRLSHVRALIRDLLGVAELSTKTVILRGGTRGITSVVQSVRLRFTCETERRGGRVVLSNSSRLSLFYSHS